MMNDSGIFQAFLSSFKRCGTSAHDRRCHACVSMW